MNRGLDKVCERFQVDKLSLNLLKNMRSLFYSNNKKIAPLDLLNLRTETVTARMSQVTDVLIALIGETLSKITFHL